MTKTHFILTTAGHVDHGKTALIRALTDIECDTHKEERERGITINLGFAHIDLEEDKSIGIIDVPGHKDFVNTMVAGANSTDIALLVVAADSGVMPQTEEHLKIMKMMNVEKGFVVITRIDLADGELIKIVEEEIKSLVNGTFLDNCSIVKTSAKTGQGIAQVKKTIEYLLKKISERESDGIFRLYIDRIFTVKGFGTVVNGSTQDGKLCKTDDVYLLPGGENLRIRRMERFGHEVETVYPGDRTSINISGLDKDQFESGMLLSKKKLKTSNKIDAQIEFFDHNRNFGIWADMLFLLGTYQEQVRVHLLDKDYISSGQKAFVQIHLQTPCVAKYGDKFILRSTSNDVTLGGGKILNIDPLHHKKRTPKVISQLNLISDKGLAGLILVTLNKYRTALTAHQIGKTLNVSKQKVEKKLKEKKAAEIISTNINKKIYFISEDVSKTLKSRVINLLKNYHKENPISLYGLNTEEFMSIFAPDIKENKEITIQLILDELIVNEVLEEIENTYILANHQRELSEEVKNELDLIDDYSRDLGFETFDRVKFLEETENKFSHGHLENLLNRLIEEKRIISIQGQLLHRETVEKGKKLIVDYLNHNVGGIEIAKFRDLIDSSRRIALLICSYCDDNKITVRRGDKRFLTEKWKNR